MENIKVKMKAVEKLTIVKSTVESKNIIKEKMRKDFFKETIPNTRIENIDKRPRVVARSVHLPTGLLVAPKKLPKIKKSLEKTFIKANVAITDKEIKKAFRALNTFFVSEKTILTIINKIEQRNM